MDLRILRLLKKTYPLRKIDIGELGRDHYFSSQGKGFIFEHIQPVHEVDKLIPFNVSEEITAIVAANTATIVVQPDPGGGIWDIYNVSMEYSGAAAKPVRVSYVDNVLGREHFLSADDGHDILPGGVKQSVFPIFADLAGAADHEHVMWMGTIQTEFGIRQLLFVITGATNGATIKLTFVYRRVL